jgi:hypothetical protein
MYFTIENPNGAGARVRALGEEALLAALNGGEYGRDEVFLDSVDNPDTNLWNGTLIIKGEIVVPKPKRVVTEYEI